VGVFRSIRRSRILREGLLSGEAWEWLLRDHPILDGLSPDEKDRLRKMATLFLHEKIFEGADGLSPTEVIREVISVQACLPILNLGMEWYEDWKTIVVVPDAWSDEHAEIDSAGVAHEWEEDKSGESWDMGPVVLSWKDVEESGWGDGYNVVIHEAAHRLDLRDGEMNGRPALHEDMSPQEWADVFSRAFADLSRRSSVRRRRLRMDPYAATDDAEFFAVASEYFFEQPEVLQSEYPQVYQLLRAFYRQDPGARRAPRRGG
jgi:Mlc titration factor MtfA (ptsG expression regulator)